MRIIVAVVSLALGGPAGVLVAHAVGTVGHGMAAAVAALPDPTTAAVMFAGLGLVVGARRGRSNAVAD